MPSEAPGIEPPRRDGNGFDGLAAGYDAWYETPVGRLVDRLETRAVLALVDRPPGALALDLSCGTGRYALALRQPGFRAVGVDRSAPMLVAVGAQRS